MKLVVQIPCLNEERTLPLVINSIPKTIKGVDSIDILIIDDGSTDKTVEVAKKLGVKHFVIHPQRKGLARSFQDGLNKALEMGADIIVNTDGDNQYPQDRIPDLIKPIMNSEAEIVIADRQTHKIEHFSKSKKLLQRFGSKVVNLAAGTDLPDAPSGFRAYSRSAAMRLNVITTFSYAMETIIQAGNKKISIVSIPIDTNPKTRESRLFKSSSDHVMRSGSAIIRAYTMYKPYVFFVSLGIFLFIVGAVPFIRYLYYAAQGERSSHVQSLLIGSVILVGAFLSFGLAIIADLIRINRVLQEETLEQIKEAKFKK